MCHPLLSLRQTHQSPSATTVHLFVFGSAEPATAIMAAAIPILRALLRRDPPNPAQFIELSRNRPRICSSSAIDRLEHHSTRDLHVQTIFELNSKAKPHMGAISPV